MLNLTDENFEEELKKAEKPVLVDFFASWCNPCRILSPIFEKLAAEYKDKIIFAKANVDAAPLTSQKFSIDKIPALILFKEGKPRNGFSGPRTESMIQEWLEENLIIEEYERYAKENGLILNPNREAVERIIRGLLQNEKKCGARYCPCRRVTGDPEEDKKKICPCDFMQTEIEEQGHCLCGLFWKE